jgi:hypothetical protein
MRESSRLRRTHLPADVFEELIKSQTARPPSAGRVRKPSKDHYEAWVEAQVEKRVKAKRRTTT